MNNNDNNRNDKAGKRILVAVVICLIIVIIILLLRQCGDSNTGVAPSPVPTATPTAPPLLDANGDIVSKDEDSVKRMRELMDESNVPVNINAVPYAERPGQPLNWLIENPEGSNKNLLVEVYLIDSDGRIGEMVYSTKGLLPPSSHVECTDASTNERLSGYDYLDVELGSGTYKAAAMFKGYTDEAEPKYVGAAQAFINITIGGGQ